MPFRSEQAVTAEQADHRDQQAKNKIGQNQLPDKSDGGHRPRHILGLKRGTELMIGDGVDEDEDGRHESPGHRHETEPEGGLGFVDEKEHPVAAGQYQDHRHPDPGEKGVENFQHQGQPVLWLQRLVHRPAQDHVGEEHTVLSIS